MGRLCYFAGADFVTFGVEMELSEETFRHWKEDAVSTGTSRRLYWTSQTALEFGMGPRGSALICGYTHYHRLLESAFADLQKTEDCLLCPTGFAANLAVITTLAGDIAQKSSSPAHVDKLSIFSDSLNHATIIEGIRLAQRQNNVNVYIYRHNDMSHLEELLLSCSLKRKAVLSDSLFSMDGDFAPLVELDALRKKFMGP